ncbi:MAG: hypothetical protein GQ557_01235, partial [Mycoplasmataceae bacterium]|nr:hypothetical protein [Mycoplasmataceae bacterium]
EVTDITLSGTGITNNYTVETSSSSVGTITLQDLDPATNYNDLIVHATFSNGNTYEQTVDIFTTLAISINPSPNDIAVVTDIDTTSAIINYSFFPGNDETDQPYEVTDITLSGTGITNNYTVESITSPTGTITLQDLDPATNYNDLIVSATFSDGNTYEQTVDIFTTLSIIIDPSPNETATVTNVDVTTATINYSLSPGNDENGDPYEVTNITLSGTGITDNYTVESITSQTGTITLQDLGPETNYNDLVVSATFSDANTYNQDVDAFTTLGHTPVVPGPNETATVTDISDTSATINYSFSPGNDINGIPYEVTDITLSGTGITDNYIVESITSPTGTITLQDLDPETNYDDLIVSITFTDGNTYQQDVDSFNTQELYYPSSVNVVKWIIILITLIILIALIVSFSIFLKKIIQNKTMNRIN